MSAPAAYDIFISYAHADALTPDGEAQIREIKQSIEEALQEQKKGTKAKTQTTRRKSRVFLDSEALKWGNEWNAKIRESIQNCKVFVYLLSPNYVKSDYCQREKLWWAKKEIEDGRLNKGVRPIYYVKLKETGDPKEDEYIKELKICQAHDKAFFQNLDEVKNHLKQEDLSQIARKIKKCLKKEKAAVNSFSSIHPPISRCFVGRLGDLAKLNDLVVGGSGIPTISGGAGVGKSELAVAYACAYAEKFPQGRFLIPMENVKTWESAMNMLVEWCRVKCNVEPKDLGLPADFEKLPLKEKKTAAYKMLLDRAKHGALLVVLDNMQKDNLKLITEKGLEELTGTNKLPKNLYMIATTRINEIVHTALNLSSELDIKNLSEKDALEFFCRISEDVFPFARYPIADGKMLLDLIPENRRPSKEEAEEIERDYEALKEIIRLLDCHAWSLEIVAGRIATTVSETGACDLRKELEGIKNTPLKQLTGTGLHRNMAYDPNMLLKPTFRQVLKQDSVVKGESLGQKMMLLAQFASFFPPDQIPKYALRDLWIYEFGDKEISFKKNGAVLTAKAFDYALTQLKQYRIINGEDSLLKMHRLTREVLLNEIPEEEKPQTIRKMELCLFESRRNLTSELLFSWCEWADEWMNKLPVVKKDFLFLDTLLSLAESCMELDLYKKAEQILDNKDLKKMPDLSLAASYYMAKGRFYAETNRAGESETSYKTAKRLYQIYLTGNKNDPRYSEDLHRYVGLLINFANSYVKNERNEDAKKLYLEAVEIIQKRGKENLETDDWEKMSMLQNNLSALYKKEKDYDKTEEALLDSLRILDMLRSENPDMLDYHANYAIAMRNLANLHSIRNQGDDMKNAEDEYSKALDILWDLKKKNLEKFLGDLAGCLHSFSQFLGRQKRYDEAQKISTDAVAFYTILKKANREKYLESWRNAQIYYIQLKHESGEKKE